ncbi:lysylphosphatidylglycerol synthase transmembrane domain-containing protein [Palleronia sp. LCG004]|uniref:lysylphosphatidylglycerol synthase transmembrane domain-containing protein n=1 Tax=Palleronia sp. LCG004 TaxID=3079304 RepID=UPI002942A23C|nr:lysylphosphatidylglycerol synthase transmembrane domain-containing protein [Palleronia sp. LCG004]WOI57293.1 lysylphosphatidylglycerol synthase transmembrane domain-containing protein [Palleronia sp. LCG004]
MKRALRFAVTGLLLALLLRAFDGADIANRLTAMDPVWMAVAVLCLWIQTFLMAMRWRLVARALGIAFPPLFALQEYFVSQLANATLPGGVVGDGARAVRSRIGETGLRRAALAVMFERAFGQAGLLVVAVAGLMSLALVPGALDWPDRLARGLAIAGLVAICLCLIVAIWLRGGRIASLLSLCLPDGRRRVMHLALAVGAALLNVAAFAAAARATGVTLSVQAALVLVPLILLAMLVPLTIGGWGWREGAAAALFPVAGASAAAGVAAGIAFGIAMLISVLPGLAILSLGPPATRDVTAADRN